MMTDTRCFVVEILGRLILITLTAAALALKWWLPLVVAPIFWQIWDTLLGRRSRILQPVMKLTADGITHVLWFGYIIYSILSFGLKLGHWYGWSIGVVVGLVVGQFLGLLWPHRWHLERIEANL